MRRTTSKDRHEISRRRFMLYSACASVGAITAASTIWDLNLMKAALGQTANPGYKAMVCIFLNGGNDGNNVLVPTDAATYNNLYVPARGGDNTGGTNATALTLPPPGTNNGAGANIGLIPLNPLTSDGHTYGLHPSMPDLASLFNSGKAAMLCNVGTLVAPITKTQYLNRSVGTPYQLFSHNDQQIQWQTSVPDKPSSTGWGGRTADLLYTLNNNSITPQVSMNISLAGINSFEVGGTVQQYNVGTSGAQNYTNSSQLATLKQLVGTPTNIASLHLNLYEQSFASTINNGDLDATLVSSATGNIDTAVPGWDTLFKSLYTPAGKTTPTYTGLANQMRMIAKLIYGRNTFGHSRQIFFAQVGGYDLHSNEGNFAGSQAGLLSDLSRAMSAFYDAMIKLGVDQNVVQFTVSDFGRTFRMNGGNGADHGWGNHAIIVGGPVVGQKLYGTYPTIQYNGPDDTDTGSGATGRWIPTTSCDEYFATLATWMGISSSQLSAVLPNIGRFAHPNLGFLG